MMTPWSLLKYWSSCFDLFDLFFVLLPSVIQCTDRHYAIMLLYKSKKSVQYFWMNLITFFLGDWRCENLKQWVDVLNWNTIDKWSRELLVTYNLALVYGGINLTEGSKIFWKQWRDKPTLEVVEKLLLWIHCAAKGWLPFIFHLIFRPNLRIRTLNILIAFCQAGPDCRQRGNFAN